MSTLIVNSLRSTTASSDGLTLDGSGNITVPGNISVTGSLSAANFSNRNLIINGAMQVAQRGTSSTSTGYQTVDRFTMYHGGHDEAPTYSQADVASGTTPYTLGFRKCLKITNGNQTSGAGAGDEIQCDYVIEAQDIANSGWDYTSASSYVTLSYWVKSSVAQEFKGHVYTKDGTQQNYPFSLGSLSADTWTKITKKIPGNSNIQVDNNNSSGLDISLFSQMGTNMTGSVTENTWAAWSASTRTPDQTLTFWTTNDATFEITGVQLEVGSTATEFEHKSYGDELARCQRYYTENSKLLYLTQYSSHAIANIFFPTTMRAAPTVAEKVNSGNLESTGQIGLNSFYMYKGSDTGTSGNGYTASAEL